LAKLLKILLLLIGENLCSLNPGEDRLAFSVIWKINSDGEIIEENFTRTVINSVVKLSYDHAQVTYSLDLSLEITRILKKFKLLEEIYKKSQ
jgi:exoribonuclease R